MYLLETAATIFPDEGLPVIFHCDSAHLSDFSQLHWHESLEILFFIDGKSEVTSDSVREPVNAGEIAVINCNHLHRVHALTAVSHYYCLIISRQLCEEMDIPVADMQFRLRISDERARLCIEKIVAELNEKKPFYKSAVKAALWEMLILFCRDYTETVVGNTAEHKKNTVVKKALLYIEEHLCEPITVEEISNAVGLSKYYFCRLFREITDTTVINYINFARCRNARRLILSHQQNVGESAERSGFTNLSYFAKTYQRHIGELPSLTVSRSRGELCSPE